MRTADETNTIQDIINDIQSIINLELSDPEIAAMAIAIRRNQIEQQRNDLIRDAFVVTSLAPSALEKIAMEMATIAENLSVFDTIAERLDGSK